jgi:hypothetical protein
MMSSHKNLLIGLGHETAENAGVNHMVKWAWSLSALFSGLAWALFVSPAQDQGYGSYGNEGADPITQLH